MVPRRAHAPGGDDGVRAGPRGRRVPLRIGALAAALLAAAGAPASAQIDPKPRRLVQAGFGQPVRGGGPAAGYLFYFWNQPRIGGTDATLRLAAAPVYADAELGVPRGLGDRTSFGLGLSGGGWADSYEEQRRGEHRRDESFTGHGGRVSASVYHLFNPGRKVPLQGVFRVSPHFAAFERGRYTAERFETPPDETSVAIRTGLRMGGIEPVLMPKAAAEASLWHEARFLAHGGAYGFGGDRRRETTSHLYWARQLFRYTFESRDALEFSLIEGASSHPDRFSAYRLGGMLPFSSEFPLSLPGYAHQELSARRFILLNVSHGLALGEDKRWTVSGSAAGAWVDYLPGFEEPGIWHSGVGADVRYRSPKDAWQFMVGYAYGLRAYRAGRRGAQSVAFLMQYDLTRSRGPFEDMRENPYLRQLRDVFLGR